MRTLRFAVAAVTMLALPLAASAQEPQGQPAPPPHHPGMMQPGQGMWGQGWMGMMGMMGPGMAVEHSGPGMLLSLRESLGLTDDQVSKLQALQQQLHQTMQQSMQEAREAHQRAAAALEGSSPDLDAHEQALKEAASHLVDAGQAMARAQVEAKQLLTADQTEKLDAVMEALKEMREAHGGRGGMHPGMMQPGMHHQGEQREGHSMPHGGRR